MAIPRFMFFVVAIVLGFGSLGCSQSPNPEPVPPADEDNVHTAAEGSNKAKQRFRWWRDESIVAELGLSDDQIETINQLMTSKTGDSTKQRQRERQLSLRYLRALNQDPYDAEMVDRLSKQLIEHLSSEHRRRIESVHALRDILTKEQWTRLWELAPRALQVGRFVATRGTGVSVKGDSEPPAALVP